MAKNTLAIAFMLFAVLLSARPPAFGQAATEQDSHINLPGLAIN